MIHLTLLARSISVERREATYFAIEQEMPSNLIVFIDPRNAVIIDSRFCVAAFHSFCLPCMC